MGNLQDTSASAELTVRTNSVVHGLSITEEYTALELLRCNISAQGSECAKSNLVIADRKFLHFSFEDFAAREVEFCNCDFSYGVFTRAYFYKARFKKCVFTGARFIDCNFRSARFIECDFSYTAFRGTIMPSKEILSNTPTQPNVRRELMRSLRVNAASVGDDDSVRSFIREELRAGEEHNRRAREAREPYYASKYGWEANKRNWLKTRAERYWLWLQRFGWGYGEYPLKFLRTTLLVLFLFIMVAFFRGGSSEQITDRFGLAVKDTISTFVGTSFGPQMQPPMGRVWITSLVLLRYVALSLFVTMLFRRLSRR